MTTCRLAALIALAMAPALSSAQAAPAQIDSASALASVSQSLPALASAVSNGADKACVPTHLTLSGPAKDGSRLFVSALIPNFSVELRKSAKGSAKITREQAHEIQAILNYAEAARKSGQGMPPEALDNFAARTGMKMSADMICLTHESVGSK